MKAFVTGTAGFIGSTLAERLLADGADVVGIDCFTDYYPRAVKERNLEALKKHPRFRFAESTIQEADLAALLSDRTRGGLPSTIMNGGTSRSMRVMPPTMDKRPMRTN